MSRRHKPRKPGKTGHPGHGVARPPSGGAGADPDAVDDDGEVGGGGGDGLLPPRQERAVAALVQEPTITRAAAAAGVHERTLRRWLREPAFRGELLRGRREAFGQAIGLTQRYAPVAVATLVKVMNDNASSPSARVTAAAVLLRFGREGIELDDLAQRVEMLERPTETPAPPAAAPQPRPGRAGQEGEEA